MSSRSAISTARSFLFVPGDRPERFGRAATSGADVVVLDLEDAVAATSKEAARQAVRSWLGDGMAMVRVSAVGTDGHPMDIAAVADQPGLLGLMLPKAEKVEEVRGVAAATGVPVMPLIETAAGVQNAAELARADATARIAVGTIDLAADLGCTESWEALLFARSTLVIASRAARIAPPVDGVHTDLNDEVGLRAAVARAAALGFSGSLLIHPRQVAAVHESLAPSDQDVAWAEAVLALPEGVAVLDGHMVDEPVRKRARMLLERASGRALPS